MTNKRAVIIGAGPAGLTAAYELLRTTDVVPIIFEKTKDVGGISKTVNYKGNRIDIGGHRFFSKSDRIMNWWLDIMPVEQTDHDVQISYQGKQRVLKKSDTLDCDSVFLIRHRISRIFYLRHFFDYPISLSFGTIKKLGVFRMIHIGLSYMKAVILPIRQEKTLEDFFINRFGRALYLTFFKDYTEKVWGESCRTIGADWGKQRIKGLSITKALIHAVKALIPKKTDVNQKDTETSLIEYFLYPKYGPGQLWEAVQSKIKDQGVEIQFQQEIAGFEWMDGQLKAAKIRHVETGEISTIEADYFISTMPVRELVAGLGDVVPIEIAHIAKGLRYRDFITVGLLLDKLVLSDGHLPDNWIYIQERDVKVGRVQVFNNWSPFMVKDPKTVWIGLEYFCSQGDDLWTLSQQAMIALAKSEMEQMGFIDQQDVLDATVIKMPKAYPGYFGDAYTQFDKIQQYTDSIENLFLVGRNGMHKYNNQDHSMLTAMAAVENIKQGITDKSNIWQVNTEQEYHEEKSS